MKSLSMRIRGVASMLAIVSILALIRTCPFAPATSGTSPSDASALPAGAVKWERLDPASIGGKFADGAIATSRY